MTETKDSLKLRLLTYAGFVYLALVAFSLLGLVPGENPVLRTLIVLGVFPLGIYIMKVGNAERDRRLYDNPDDAPG